MSDTLLPFHTSPHGLSLCGQELLDGVINNTLEAIRHAIYPVEIILWTDAFMPHNVVIKKCGSVHTCTATIGRPNDDRLGSYSYPIWLDRKDNDRFLVKTNLVEELNNSSTIGMKVYHPGLKKIVRIIAKLYVFLCDPPDKVQCIVNSIKQALCTFWVYRMFR